MNNFLHLEDIKKHFLYYIPKLLRQYLKIIYGDTPLSKISFAADVTAAY